MRGSDVEIYKNCLARINDINRVQFNYRILYMTMLAGYFTAISYFQGIAARATFIEFLDAYVLVFSLISLAALIGVFVLSMLDAAHQELQEHCVSSAECIEYTNETFTDRRVFARPSQRLISVLINFAIFLFYAVPGMIIFGITYFTFMFSRLEKPAEYFPQIADAACPYLEQYDDKGIVSGYVPLASCVQKIVEIRVSPMVAEINAVCFWAAVLFGVLLLLIHTHRIVGRLLRLFARVPYPKGSVRGLPPPLRQIPLKENFDKIWSKIVVAWICLSVLYIGYRALGLILGTWQA